MSCSGGKGMQMSRVYEVMFIVRPDVTEEDTDKLIAGFSTTITAGGGAVRLSRRWAGASSPTWCASSTTATTFC